MNSNLNHSSKQPLSARQQAGQLIMIRLAGTELTEEQAQYLRSNAIRAVCLFRPNMVNAAQLAKLTADLRAAMGENALIAIDQEGGAVVRATWLPSPPAAMGLGAADDVELARAVGAAVARGIKALGFNWNFAPVLDMNNNLHNPVIAERSFGADPQRATELAMAWMDGSLAEGVACCVKHAPGHGDTHVDSHRDLPTVDKSLASLQALEFSPFKQAAPYAPAMMTAHIVYPALDPHHPATMSRRILTELVRDEWQFKGVVITDGMDMHAIAGRFGVGSAAAQALLAGADMVMALGDRNTQEETLNTLADLIESGGISESELQARQLRLDQLAARYPSLAGQVAPAYAQVTQDHALMAQAWQRSLTQYHDPKPPELGSKLHLVVRADVAHDGVSEKGLAAQQLFDWLSQWFSVEMTTFANAEEFAWDTIHNAGQFTILASTSRLRYPERAKREWHPDLHLCLWNPFQCLDVNAPALLSYGFAPPALAAVGDWLQGKSSATGRNPCFEIADLVKN